MSARRFKTTARFALIDREHQSTALEIPDAVSSVNSQDIPEALRLRIPGIGNRRPQKVASTVQLLTTGGDSRIACGPLHLNRYGCSPLPDPSVLAYGSSTASTISREGFAAADALRLRLKRGALIEAPAVTYKRELDRVRRELTRLCRLQDLCGLEIIIGASGTDLHFLAGQLVADSPENPPLIVRVESSETGTGVPDALAGRHFNDRAALGDSVLPSFPLDGARPVQIHEVKCRNAEGADRCAAEIDAEVEEIVGSAAATGRRVLLTLVDVSKTGLIAPSPGCADSLQCRFPHLIQVLVDACQFRMSPSTLRAYLEHNFLVAVTGSKFIPGPSFCGALFVPERAAVQLAKRTLPRGLKSYSASADWPRHWAARAALDEVPNYGLLLRWEAALTELRAFSRLPESAIAEFLQIFSRAVMERLVNCPAFEPLPVPALDRAPIVSVGNWDRVATLFPFLLLRPATSGKRIWLTQSETKTVHELLRQNQCDQTGSGWCSVMSSRCQLGQPVSCGTREGVPVSALRLCLSARLVVDAVGPDGRGSEAVIADAMAVLDKAALLTSTLHGQDATKDLSCFHPDPLIRRAG